MEPLAPFTRIEEPFWRVLARSVAIAVLVAAVFALRRHALEPLFPVALLALWFSLGGHYVELAFLNGLRPRLPRQRLTLSLARVPFWWAGGALLYLGMAATGHALGLRGPPFVLWWLGGLVFIGVELAVHTMLALGGRPSFFDGRH